MARVVPESELRLSPAPTAELAAGAVLAQKDAKLDGPTGADFIVIAVPPGKALEAVAQAAQAAVDKALK